MTLTQCVLQWRRCQPGFQFNTAHVLTLLNRTTGHCDSRRPDECGPDETCYCLGEEKAKGVWFCAFCLSPQMSLLCLWILFYWEYFPILHFSAEWNHWLISQRGGEIIIFISTDEDNGSSQAHTNYCHRENQCIQGQLFQNAPWNHLPESTFLNSSNNPNCTATHMSNLFPFFKTYSTTRSVKIILGAAPLELVIKMEM